MACRGVIVMGVILIIWITLQQSQKGGGAGGGRRRRLHKSHNLLRRKDRFQELSQEPFTSSVTGHTDKTYQKQLGGMHHQIIETLRDIHELFTRSNVWYVIQFGTLLGAVRHHGIIPWDDDADLVVLRKDRKKLWALKGELEKRGYRLESTWKLDRIYCNKDKSKEIPFIDLFYIDFDETGKSKRCILTGDKFCQEVNGGWWWKTRPTKNELAPRKLYSFNGIKLYGPAKAQELLEREYGANVLNECKSHVWDHLEGKPIPSKNLSCGNLPKPQLP